MKPIICEKCNKVIKQVEEIENTTIKKTYKWNWAKRKYDNELDKEINRETWIYCKKCNYKKRI